MFRLIGILGIFSLCCLAENHRLREETSQATWDSGWLIPAVYRGYVYWAGGRDGDERVVNVYGPDGNLDLLFVQDEGDVRNIAFDTDGTVAVSWWDMNKKTGGIDFRDTYGQVTKTIATGRYLPCHLVFGEDHSLWTFGNQVDSRSYEDKQDYMTVRKYSPDGQETGAYLPRSLFPGELPAATETWQWHSVFLAKDRIGIWAMSGSDGAKTEWVELDLNGKLLSRKRLDEFKGDMAIALTRDARLYIQHHSGNPHQRKLYVLDRDSSTWRLIDDPPAGYLIGADDNTLEFEDATGPVHLSWYEPPAPTEKAAAVLLK